MKMLLSPSPSGRGQGWGRFGSRFIPVHRFGPALAAERPHPNPPPEGEGGKAWPPRPRGRGGLALPPMHWG